MNSTIAEANAHIPTDEILKDIADTEREIATMSAEADHFEGTPLSLPTARWDHMRAGARRSGIKQRREFIDKLEQILRARNICPKCGNQVDPEVCHCGDPIKNHNADHRPVPMGCTCGYNQPEEKPFA